MDNMFEMIKEVAVQIFGCEVNQETSQTNCEAWDSLHHLNFVVELEMKFNVFFEPEEIAMIKTIGEVEKILETKLS